MQDAPLVAQYSDNDGVGSSSLVSPVAEGHASQQVPGGTADDNDDDDEDEDEEVLDLELSYPDAEPTPSTETHVPPLPPGANPSGSSRSIHDYRLNRPAGSWMNAGDLNASSSQNVHFNHHAPVSVNGEAPSSSLSHYFHPEQMSLDSALSHYPPISDEHLYQAGHQRKRARTSLPSHFPGSESSRSQEMLGFHPPHRPRRAPSSVVSISGRMPRMPEVNPYPHLHPPPLPPSATIHPFETPPHLSARQRSFHHDPTQWTSRPLANYAMYEDMHMAASASSLQAHHGPPHRTMPPPEFFPSSVIYEDMLIPGDANVSQPEILPWIPPPSYPPMVPSQSATPAKSTSYDRKGKGKADVNGLFTSFPAKACSVAPDSASNPASDGNSAPSQMIAKQHQMKPAPRGRPPRKRDQQLALMMAREKMKRLGMVMNGSIPPTEALHPPHNPAVAQHARPAVNHYPRVLQGYGQGAQVVPGGLKHGCITFGCMGKPMIELGSWAGKELKCKACVLKSWSGISKPAQRRTPVIRLAPPRIERPAEEKEKAEAKEKEEHERRHEKEVEEQKLDSLRKATGLDLERPPSPISDVSSSESEDTLRASSGSDEGSTEEGSGSGSDSDTGPESEDESEEDIPLKEQVPYPKLFIRIKRPTVLPHVIEGSSVTNADSSTEQSSDTQESQLSATQSPSLIDSVSGALDLTASPVTGATVEVSVPAEDGLPPRSPQLAAKPLLSSTPPPSRAPELVLSKQAPDVPASSPPLDRSPTASQLPQYPKIRCRLPALGSGLKREQNNQGNASGKVEAGDNVEQSTNAGEETKEAAISNLLEVGRDVLPGGDAAQPPQPVAGGVEKVDEPSQDTSSSMNQPPLESVSAPLPRKVRFAEHDAVHIIAPRPLPGGASSTNMLSHASAGRHLASTRCPIRISRCTRPSSI
ncbi:hypothetical protein HGRIS_014797 [Hohenbuehelia grisea]|uniref:Uncharacterized protein n=1 Tax=Hohenbuehelia grisea TaxID=104357 RepID=A0ABR3IQW1_9AGAR